MKTHHLIISVAICIILVAAVYYNQYNQLEQVKSTPNNTIVAPATLLDANDVTALVIVTSKIKLEHKRFVKTAIAETLAKLTLGDVMKEDAEKTITRDIRNLLKYTQISIHRVVIYRNLISHEFKVPVDNP